MRARKQNRAFRETRRKTTNRSAQPRGADRQDADHDRGGRGFARAWRFLRAKPVKYPGSRAGAPEDDTARPPLDIDGA